MQSPYGIGGSAALGLLAAIIVAAFWDFVSALLPPDLSGQAIDAFSFLGLPLAALAGSLVVARRHPSAPRVLIVSYFVAVMAFIAVAAFFISAHFRGVEF